MTLKAVIFDMDGTLFDTEKLFADSIISAAKEEGWDLERNTVIDSIGTTAEETRRIITHGFGSNFPYEIINNKSVEKFWEYIKTNGVPLKNGVPRILKMVKAMGLPMGLATSTYRERVQDLLTISGTIDFFSATACGDEVVNGKPDPEIYRKLADRLHVAPENILVFEDSAPGIISAASAGARVIWVPDLQPISEEVRKLCHKETGSLDAACDKFEKLIS